VIANHILYHVPDQAWALAEMQRVLKPDGVVYLATNGRSHLRELHELEQRGAIHITKESGMFTARKRCG
jgi:ubiquinone/menaquinone biosynthesis C-methylase UbiE